MPHRNPYFNAILDLTEDGIVVINERGIIRSVNKACSRLFGYTVDDLVGQNVSCLMPEPDKGHHNQYIKNYLQTCKAQIIGIGRHVKAQKKTGEIFNIHLSVKEVESDTKDRVFCGIIHSTQQMRDYERGILEKSLLLERAEYVAHLGHWHLNLETGKVYWSKQVYLIHGVLPQEYEPDMDSAVNYYHPDDREAVRQTIQQAIEKKEKIQFEKRLVRPDGEVRYVRSYGEPELDEDGTVIGIFGVFLDITDEVTAKAEIAERQAVIETVFDNVPDPIFVKDQEFRIVNANQAFLDMYPEGQRDRVIGHTTVEEYKEEEANAFLEQDRIAFETGFSEVEETLDFPDGKRRTLLTKKVRYIGKNEAPYILGISRDVTDFLETQQRLQESEFARDAYSEAANDGYWDWYLKDDYQYMSPKFWTMMGYDPSKKTHHPSEWQKLIFPEDLELAMDNFDKHVESHGA